MGFFPFYIVVYKLVYNELRDCTVVERQGLEKGDLGCRDIGMRVRYPDVQYWSIHKRFSPIHLGSMDISSEYDWHSATPVDCGQFEKTKYRIV